MTVSYSSFVSTPGLNTFTSLLFRWKASLYKALWREILVFLCAYYSLSIIYRFLLNSAQREVFEIIAQYSARSVAFIPLSFLLDMFINIVFNRWWLQFTTGMAWPDTVAIFVSCYLSGTDERSRMLRRTIIRYINLSFVLGLRNVSPVAKKRFPTMHGLMGRPRMNGVWMGDRLKMGIILSEHLVNAVVPFLQVYGILGFLTEEELKLFENVPTKYMKFWVPCQWACGLLVKAREENRITDDRCLTECVRAVNDIRVNVRDLGFFDWISIPLLYTQTVFAAVYIFFLASVIGHQHIEGTEVKEQEINLYFPIFAVLQFIFFVGRLKAAEVMINPWGEDDDDFEVNFIIDRNIQVSLVIVDDNYDLLAPLQQDLFWETSDVQIPHTVASAATAAKHVPQPCSGSAVQMRLSDPETLPPEKLFNRSESEKHNVADVLPHTTVPGHVFEEIRKHSSLQDVISSLRSSFKKVLNQQNSAPVDKS